MITVKVNIQSVLEEYVQDKKDKLNSFPMKETSTIKDLITALGIPQVEIDMMVLNDRIWFDKDYQLQNGDTIDLFPSINGG